MLTIILPYVRRSPSEATEDIVMGYGVRCSRVWDMRVCVWSFVTLALSGHRWGLLREGIYSLRGVLLASLVP